MKTINNRSQAQVSKIEFARVQEGYAVVRITCKTARPEKASVSTHLVPGAAAGESPDSRAIQNAIGELREEYPGTKIVVDPDAELEPLAPLFKWTYGWQKPLARASLGLNWEKDFPLYSYERAAAGNTLDAADWQWVITHGREIIDSEERGIIALVVGSTTMNGVHDGA